MIKKRMLLLTFLLVITSVVCFFALAESEESVPLRYFAGEGELLEDISFSQFADMGRTLYVVRVLEHTEEKRLFREWPVGENGYYVTVDTEPVDTWECMVKSLRCEILYSEGDVDTGEILFIECMDEWTSYDTAEVVKTPWSGRELPAPGQRLLVFGLRNSSGLGVKFPEMSGKAENSNLVYMICEDGSFISSHNIYVKGRVEL